MITIVCKHLDPLCRDYEFQVVDKDQLADYITKLIMGWCRHITRVLRGLDPHYPNIDEATINSQIRELKNPETEKVDGWLFQMISWLVLAEQHKNDPLFFQHFPHPQKAMHGVDGIAVSLNDDGSINRIIITEDKCTDHPRYVINQQVFTEFVSTEAGEKNNAIMQHIEALVTDEDNWIQIQNDIVKPEYRQYRIAITRKDFYDSENGRKRLFKDYDTKVKGVDVERRICSTTNFNGMRAWMDDLRLTVIRNLEQLIP